MEDVNTLQSLIKKGTDIEFVDNPGNSQSRGAGMSAAQFVVDQGVANVISGNIGPNAKNVLINAGIKIDIKEKVPLKTILEELSKNENKE